MTLLFLALFLGCFFSIIISWIFTNKLGFLAQRPSDYTKQGTVFDIRERLIGHMICEGVIYGPFGRVNTRFVAHMHANWDGDKGHMTESFLYDNGDTLDREWDLIFKDNGEFFEAKAPDIIGIGIGQQSGSGVRLCYNIKLPVSAGGYVLNTTDWMYLMENGTIINRSQFRKFGFKVGELVANMRQAN